MAWFRERFARPRIARLVDCGKVFCPVRLADVDVEGCAECPFLADLVADEMGTASEIVCEPKLRALIGGRT